jgi:hypothetical protein
VGAREYLLGKNEVLVRPAMHARLGHGAPRLGAAYQRKRASTLRKQVNLFHNTASKPTHYAFGRVNKLLINVRRIGGRANRWIEVSTRHSRSCSYSCGPRPRHED